MTDSLLGVEARIISAAVMKPVSHRTIGDVGRGVREPNLAGTLARPQSSRRSWASTGAVCVYLLLAAQFSVERANAGSYEITEAVLQTYDPSKGTDVTGGVNIGVPWNDGVVGNFILTDSEAQISYGMSVSTSNPGGALSGHSTSTGDSIMVARTSNSQGLTDPGTLSIFIWEKPDKQEWSLDVTFSFFELGPGNSFGAPIELALTLTSLDIDSGQRLYTSNADFDTNITASNTYLTPAASISGFSGFTTTRSGVYDDARFAIASKGVGDSFTLRLQNDERALFMFEFRDPSTIVPDLVPEPGSAMLAGLGSLYLLGVIRRRRKI